MRDQARRFYHRTLDRIASKYREDDLRRSAVVFSPHFDDETLGCGGTILKKREAGADVKIVFMTDGSKSHAHLMSESESKTVRKREGLAASRSLGLNAHDVFFLDFEETKLDDHVGPAIDEVRDILLKERPEEVFIPYHREPLLWSADHVATNRIVASALRMYGRKTIICEYPIWFWCHWPWARLRLRSRRKILTHFRNHSFIHGLSLLRDFRCLVDIKDVIELKRAALSEHRSQMTRLIPDPRWRTLHDVSDGEFLECFFQEYEIFHKYGAG